MDFLTRGGGTSYLTDQKGTGCLDILFLENHKNEENGQDWDGVSSNIPGPTTD